MTVEELDDPPATPPPTVNVALYYATIGLRVFPLQPGLKIPYRGSRGLLDATTDPQLITVWWEPHSRANLAIATGHHIDVIDIDGREGANSYAHLQGLPEPLGIVRTPRGRHIYIPATGRGNKAAIAPGIDYRGLGGYVVAPPSINQDGTRYRWTRPLRLTHDG